MSSEEIQNTNIAETNPGDTCPVPGLPSSHLPDFATGSIFRPILKMGWPSIIGFLAVNIYDVVDLFWVAKLGASYVAAIALFEGFFWALTATNDIAGLGSVAVISRRYGEGDLAAAATSVKETFILKWICAAFSGIIGLVFMEDLMRLMGAEGEVVTLGAKYGRIHMITLGFYFCTYSVFTSLRSVEAPKLAMVLMLGGAGLNLILDPLMIFGYGPFPALGIAGAAWASAISHTVALAAGLWVLFSGRAPIRLKWRGEVPVRFRTMLHQAKVGLPGGVNTISFSLARAVVTPLVAIFGTSVVAAYGVNMRVTLIGIMVIFGLGLGVSPLVGNLLGAGLKERARKTAQQSILFGTLITTGISLLLFIFAPQIYGIFFDEPEVIAIGIELLRIISLGLPFVAVWIMSESVFHGAGDNVPPMVISLISSWGIEIPGILLVIYGFSLTETAVWWARLGYFIFGSAVAYFWMLRGRWLKKAV